MRHKVASAFLEMLAFRITASFDGRLPVLVVCHMFTVSLSCLTEYVVNKYIAMNVVTFVLGFVRGTVG